MNIHDLKGLSDWLASKNIDIRQWGKGSAKTIDSLWSEIASGESILHDDPPLRTLNVAQVFVIKGNKTLVETEQILSDGRRRSRNSAPSEKMLLGESPFDAAVRCLQEELGVRISDIKIIDSSYRKSIKYSFSPSYPGLKSRYIIHTVEVEIKDLPESDFWTTEAHHDATLGAGRHYWSWR